jgi:hypothetical protein
LIAKSLPLFTLYRSDLEAAPELVNRLILAGLRMRLRLDCSAY